MSNIPANPYVAPEAVITPAAGSTAVLATAKAQKLLMYSILLNLSTIILTFIPILSLLTLPLALASLIMGIIGIIRLAMSLGMHTALTVLCVLLMVVPLVNLIVLLVLNGKATKRIRDAGFRVGLMGADVSAIQAKVAAA